MGLLLFYIGLALSVSFLCSIMEATLLSVTPAYVAALVEEGHATAERLRRLRADIDRPLAAILSLNTIANTAGAVAIGAQAESVFGSAAVGIMSAVLTLLILVCSEIIPKTLGAAYWRQLAPPLARILVGLVKGMAPFVWLSQRITRMFSPARREEPVSREELTAMAALGARQGVFAEGESKILQNLLKLGRLTTGDIMTPRTVVFALPDGETVGSVVERVQAFPFSRIPVYHETLDSVTGYVMRDDVLVRAARSEADTPLATLKREIKAVPASLPLPVLFDDLLRGATLIALVVDEYGGTAGVVSMEDLVETLLGMEIVDEVDAVADMQELARRQWKRRAERIGLPVDGALAAPRGALDAAGPSGATPGDGDATETGRGKADE